MHLGSGLAFRSMPSDKHNGQGECARKAATVGEVLGVEVALGPCAATRTPKPTLAKLITKPTVRLNGKAPMPMPSTRAVPSGEESDDESGDDVICKDPTTVFSKDAFLNPDLPDLSEDEDEPAKPLPSMATKQPKPKPLPVKVAREQLSEEEKAAKKVQRDEDKRELEHTAAAEKRRVEREEQASMRAQALSVIDGSLVKLGKTSAQITSHALLMRHRARAVPGVADILAKRTLLDDPRWLPPTFVRTENGAIICKTGVRAMHAYEDHQSFLDAVKKLKTARVKAAHARLACFV